MLEASAGTGKTFTIASLVARYVAEGVATMDELLVVSFSRESTRELRGARAGATGQRPRRPRADPLASAADDCLHTSRAERTSTSGDAGWPTRSRCSTPRR